MKERSSIPAHLVHRPASPSRAGPGKAPRWLAGGHEIAHHSWAHIPPASQTRAEEEADLVRANESDRERLAGRAGPRLSLALVGPEPAHHRPPDHARLSLRLEPDGRRLSCPTAPAAATAAALGKPYRLRRADDIADRNADLVVARRPPAFRVRPHARRRVAPGLQPARVGDAEAGYDEFTLHEEDASTGALLTYTMHPLRHRARLSHARARGPGRPSLRADGAVFMTMEQAAEEAKEKLFG